MRKVYIFFCLFLLTKFLSAQDSGYWITREPMPTPRQEMPHAVLNGKIYVAGGIVSNSFEVTSIVEVFDPVKNTWSESAPMPASLHHHTINSLNGKLYVIGGYLGGSFSQPQNKVYEYNPVKDEWSETTPFPFEIAAHASVSFNGKIYVFGGRTLNLVYNVGYEFDPVVKTWNPLTSMSVPREHLTAAVNEQFIFVIGGRNSSGNTGAVEVYEPSTDKWFSAETLPTPRSGLTAAALNGKIYVCGGEIPDVFGENEEFNPVTGKWRTMAPMLTPRHGIGSAVVSDTIYIIGGGAIAGFHQSNINEGFVYALNTNMNEEENIIHGFRLYQNFPNPFNPSTIIRFELSRKEFVSLKVYDIIGSEVATLVNEEVLQGIHEVQFNSADVGKNLAGGLYFYQLKAGSLSETKKLILLK